MNLNRSNMSHPRMQWELEAAMWRAIAHTEAARMTSWHYKRLEAGHLIIATAGGVSLAYCLTDSELNRALEPEWAFWSAIRTLSRSMQKVAA